MAKEVFVKDGAKLEVFEDMTKIKDSMQMASGDTICVYTSADGKFKAKLEVMGEVRVFYYPTGRACDDSEGPFSSYIDFPEEVQKLFDTGEAYDSSKVYVDSNNWFEMSYLDENGDWCDSDVCEEDICGKSGSIENLFDVCKEYLECYRKNVGE